MCRFSASTFDDRTTRGPGRPHQHKQTHNCHRPRGPGRPQQHKQTHHCHRPRGPGRPHQHKQTHHCHRHGTKFSLLCILALRTVPAVKISIFYKIQYGGLPLCCKTKNGHLSATVWPIDIKFDKLTRIDLTNRIGS